MTPNDRPIAMQLFAELPEIPEPTSRAVDDDDALRLEQTLRDVVEDPSGACPPRLREALRHAVFPGGARVRPRLCLEVARACGRPMSDANEVFARAAAASVELMHCASLVHDDLPCFDDAALRRGVPSVHRAYGEAMAVLVGDGLLVLAFETLARAVAASPSASGACVGAPAILALARASGAHGGLVAGQAWELEAGVAPLVAYHRAKTASLFELAATLGAMAGGAEPGPFTRLGLRLGMAYQAADDLLDRTGNVAELGKPVGRDLALGRPTAAGGDVDVARARLATEFDAVIAAVPPCPGHGRLEHAVRSVVAELALRCRLAPPSSPVRRPPQSR